MTDSHSSATTPSASRRDRDGGRRSPAKWFADQPRWKKVTIVAAGGLMAVGGVFMVIDSGAPATGPTGPGGAAPSFVDTGGGRSGAGAAEPTWSSGLFRLGFSFFAGFCIGYAARTFLKVAALAVGVALLLLFGLSYFELLTVNWDKMDATFQSLGDRISKESERFQSFITGSLPSVGMAGFGLFTGFKKS